MIAELLANNKFDDAQRLISEKLENNEITEQEYASYCVQISDAYNAYFFANKEAEKNQLNARIQALEERNTFLENCIMEMAEMVYA